MSITHSFVRVLTDEYGVCYLHLLVGMEVAVVEDDRPASPSVIHVVLERVFRSGRSRMDGRRSPPVRKKQLTFVKYKHKQKQPVSCFCWATNAYRRPTKVCLGFSGDWFDALKGCTTGWMAMIACISKRNKWYWYDFSCLSSQTDLGNLIWHNSITTQIGSITMQIGLKLPRKAKDILSLIDILSNILAQSYFQQNSWLHYLERTDLSLRLDPIQYTSPLNPGWPNLSPPTHPNPNMPASPVSPPGADCGITDASTVSIWLSTASTGASTRPSTGADMTASIQPLRSGAVANVKG